MFAPVSTALGALLLSAGTTVLLYTSGRILGISGILRSLPGSPSLSHNLPLLTGIAASVPLIKLLLPSYIPAYPSIEESGLGYGLVAVVICGALTGWGTKAGAGCTSGHMMCGLSRFSVRSLIAVGTFFPVAVLTTGFSPVLNTLECEGGPCYTTVWPSRTDAGIMVALVVISLSVNSFLPRWLEKEDLGDDEVPEERTLAKAGVAFLAGLEFGMGLLISGMADPMKPLRFFALPFDVSKWDPSLALIMVFGLGVNIVITQIRGLDEKPVLDKKLWLPEGKVSDVGFKYVLGAAAFGVSWGLTGSCPGPAFLRVLGQPAWGVAWLAGFWTGGMF